MIVETIIVCLSLCVIFMTTSSILEHIIDLRSDELEEYKKTAEKALEEKQTELEASEKRYDRLAKGELPNYKEKEYQDTIANLESRLKAVTIERNNWKAAYERDIGYPIFEGSKKKKTKIVASLPKYTNTPPPSPSPSLDVILNEIDKKAERENHLSSLPFSGINVADYIKSIEKNAMERMEQSQFEIQGLYVKPSEITPSHITERGKAVPELMSIKGNAPFFAKIRSVKKNEENDYYTSLYSCSCPATDSPCKHMLFLARQFGLFYHEQETAFPLLEKKIEELQRLVKENKQQLQEIKKASKRKTSK